MSECQRKYRSANILYDSAFKHNNILKNGYIDMTRPGWGQALANHIMSDLEEFGIPMELINRLSIDDDGQFIAEYMGINGVKKLVMNIVRSKNEITDNQLREQLNNMVKDISDYVLEKGGDVGYIRLSRMFYGEMIGNGNDAKNTCVILSKIYGRYAICEPLNYNCPSQLLDCRKCNVPGLFQETAHSIIKGLK